MASQEPEHDHDEDEEEDEDDEVDDVPVPVAAALRARTSVSAEAFGEWNKRKTYVPPVHAKTEEQLAELMETLQRSFLFSTLELKDLQAVAAAMNGPMVLEPGMRIIQEGNTGDHLYVVQDGILDCTKVIDGVEMVVKTCERGDLFGELALLYNCPRAASVVSRDASCVWELDRETFNSIVMEAVQRKRTQCLEVLRRVPLFQSMSEGELYNVIDALNVQDFAPGTTIIEQGDHGNHFFIIYDGQVIATRVPPEGGEPVAYIHEVGDYFGELALLRNEPRAATVVTRTQVRLLSMDRATFKRLMGPAEEFLQRGVARYDGLPA